MLNLRPGAEHGRETKKIPGGKSWNGSEFCSDQRNRRTEKRNLLGRRGERGVFERHGSSQRRRIHRDFPDRSGRNSVSAQTVGGIRRRNGRQGRSLRHQPGQSRSQRSEFARRAFASSKSSRI